MHIEFDLFLPPHEKLCVQENISNCEDKGSYFVEQNYQYDRNDNIQPKK